MAFLGQIHNQLATSVTIFSGLVTLFALYLLITRQPISGNFWGAVAVGEILIILHALTGLAAWIFGGIPARGVHFLYGATAVITWPAIYAYTQGETGRPLIWVLASMFLFGVTLRSSETGRLAFDAVSQLLSTGF